MGQTGVKIGYGAIEGVGETIKLYQINKLNLMLESN